MTPLRKACSEARPRADFRTRGRLRELFSVDSSMVYQLCRMTYLVVLATTLAHPVPQEEDRWALAVLIGLDVREVAAAVKGHARSFGQGFFLIGAKVTLFALVSPVSGATYRVIFAVRRFFSSAQKSPCSRS